MRGRVSWIVRKLRDLDAFLTAYGQCIRCHRSWRYAEHVTVWFRPNSGTFILCIDCWQEERVKLNAGLILQGWMHRFLVDHPRSAEVRGELLAAYGMAHRFPVELEATGGRPWSYGVRVLDRRRPRAEELDIDQLQQDGAQEPMDHQWNDPWPWPEAKEWARRFHAFVLGPEGKCAFCALHSDAMVHRTPPYAPPHDDGHEHTDADGADGRDSHAS